MLSRIVENAKLRPSTVGLDGSYGEYVAFFNGLDLGFNDQILPNFSKWIAALTYQEGWNLIWPVLVLREAGIPSWNKINWHQLEASENALAVEKLFELLDAYLDSHPG